jgi:hypothetical protein
VNQLETSVIAAPHESRWWMSAALGGYASFVGAFTTAARAAVDLGQISGFGAIFDGGIESQRTTHAGPGAVQASLVYLSLLARYRITHAAFAGVFGLGARLFHIAASSSGYVDPSPQTVWSPAAAASAEVQWSPLAGFYLCATVQGFARAGEVQLVIRGLNVVDHIGPFGVTAGLGMGLRLQ